jgi:hypothetical protein
VNSFGAQAPGYLCRRASRHDGDEGEVGCKGLDGFARSGNGFGLIRMRGNFGKRSVEIQKDAGLAGALANERGGLT